MKVSELFPQTSAFKAISILSFESLKQTNNKTTNHTCVNECKFDKQE